MKIDIEQLHKAHFTSGRSSGQTIYALDSLIRAIQLGKYSTLVYLSSIDARQSLFQPQQIFRELLVQEGIEFRHYFSEDKFFVRDANLSAQVLFRVDRTIDTLLRLRGYKSTYIIKD